MMTLDKFMATRHVNSVLLMQRKRHAVGTALNLKSMNQKNADFNHANYLVFGAINAATEKCVPPLDLCDTRNQFYLRYKRCACGSRASKNTRFRAKKEEEGT